MLIHLLVTCFTLALILIPGVVFCLAARRLWLSRSRNAALYWLVGGFSFAGMTGALGSGAMGAPVDAGGAVMAAASLPMWLLVRFAAALGRGYGDQPPPGPVFASVRGPAAGA